MTITAGELALDQENHEALMWDTCQRLIYSATRDAAGQPIASYADGAVYPCGYNATASREIQLSDMTVVRSEAELRLPVDAEFNTRDRVKVLSAGGRLLAVPPVYEIVGDLRQGPSGLRLDLRRVSL